MLVMNNYAIQIICLAASYMSLAWLGLSVAVIEGTVSPFWPASGLAIAALVLWSPRLWPAIAVGAFAANFLIAGNPIAVAAGIATGNTLEALLGAWVLRRLDVRGEISSLRDAAVLLAVELLASMPSFMAGVFSMYLGGMLPWDVLPWACLIWWLGNSLGTFIVLPLMLAWAGQRVPGNYPNRPAEFAGAIVLIVTLSTIAHFSGHTLSKIGVPVIPPAPFIFPPIVWAMLRLRPRETMLVLAIGCACVVYSALAKISGWQNIGPIVFLHLVLMSVGGGWLILFGAIAQRNRADEALRRSEARFRNYFNQPMIGIAITSAEKGWIEVNTRLCEILGYSREEITRLTWAEITHPDDIAGDVAQFERVIRGEIDGYSMDKRFMRRDGSTIHVATSVSCVRTDEGKVDYFVALIRDITERKKAEAEKANLEEQVQQLQKMESVGRLAGGVAHDFNNMLTVIRGNAALAIEQVDPGKPTYTELVEIRKAADRSADLTRQLLAFARRQIVAPKVLDLNGAVQGIITMLQRLIGEDINLKWLPGADLWSVKVDPSQIDQILANLCINARDAIVGVGNIAIETSNSTFDEDYCAAHLGFVPGNYVRISVSDNGHGMDKETLAHIFEPFFTTKGAGKGTGLGLATVYGAVKQNNGFINVYSEPGTGTTFTIYLPRHVGGVGQEEHTAGKAGTPVRGQETILLVEDEPSILKLTERILTRQGYAVLSAKAPGEAIRLASEYVGTIHLLMTDVVMPEMNGRDLANNLQSRYPSIKVLFMSGYTANIIVHQGVLDQGVQFIEKPFAVDDLSAKIRAVLDSE